MHWRARIVGDGVSKMEDLQHGDTVKLEQAIAETYFVKEKNKAFSSIVIFDLTRMSTRPKS